jgi:hypothetical protein
MRTFVGLLLAVVVVAVALAAFGWIYFYNDGERMGVGVNRNEVVEESQGIADSVAESVSSVGSELDDVVGRNRAESAPVVDSDR